MGIEEGERQSIPPPWGGWPSAQKGNAHGVEEIVYDGNEIAFFQKKKKNRVFPDYKHSAAYGRANGGDQEVRFTPFIHPIRTFSPPFLIPTFSPPF